MRILLSTLILTTFLSAKAQSYLPGHSVAVGYIPWQPFAPSIAFGSGDLSQKWQLRPYASLQAGYAFFNGGASFLSVPAGVALFHPLNKNLTAFAGVSVAPVAFSMSRLYTDPAVNASYPYNLSRPYGVGLNAGVQGGLIYTNDAKTFSISGSVELQRGSYPVYPPNSTNTKHP
jgi:hypothetical protein